MKNRQMELGFTGAQALRKAQRRQRKHQRATWWFDQMRRVVDQAMDWSPASPNRAEQPWLPGTRREVGV